MSDRRRQAKHRAPPLLETAGAVPYPKPAMRKLRVYAFDPQASNELATSTVNDAVIGIPWEESWERPLTPGPCGEYLEVIDHDPASGLVYAPVDLNDAMLLAQNGLPPSEGRPQFHQQMVYAVAMKTIRLFERALGRLVVWAREPSPEQSLRREHGRTPDERDFITRLRIYPHAMREANAYYSPDKTALLFGYFRPRDGNEQGDQWVFTCLSQDIIAHETTHAILHGVHRRSIQPSNLDTLAFHEAFADLVALFQHFTMTDVVAHQLSHARGDLRGATLLTGLARQFGQAIGRQGSLRHALDLVKDRQAAEAIADPDEREEARRRLRISPDVVEPHKRGGFLVAAVFDAFVTIYERRTADLWRIATGSSSPGGAELLPDLVRRLATEASKSADHILRMCVRALDYIPPVDMRFGEYLRAIITADADLVPDDPLCYRVAIAESFRNCGIMAPGCLSMSPDSLMWEAPDPAELPPPIEEGKGIFADLLPLLKINPDYSADVAGEEGRSLRDQSIRIIKANQRVIWDWLNAPTKYDDKWETLLGVRLLALDKQPKGRKPLLSVRWAPGKEPDHGILPKVEVHSARVARRAGPDGQELNQLVVQIAQRRAGFFSPEKQRRADELGEGADEPDFWFRGGATLLIDLRDGRLRNVIRKRIDHDGRLADERLYYQENGGEFAMAVYGDSQNGRLREPFALIHRS